MRLAWLVLAACVALGACVPYPYYYGGYGYRHYGYHPYSYAPSYTYGYVAPY